MKPDIAAPRRPPTVAPAIAAVLAGLVLLGLVLGPLSTLFERPSIVPRITFINPSEYDLAIEATDDGRDGWVSVGTARRKSTTIQEEIIDQGDVWIFRFAAQGQDAGDFEISRDDLERSNWTVRIPDTIAEELRAQGAPPSP